MTYMEMFAVAVPIANKDAARVWSVAASAPPSTQRSRDHG
jgi:uncharacterized protein YbaA (DUF1428 family)